MRSLSQRFAGGWKSGGPETPCGLGSTLASTSRLRRWLPSILKTLRINSINDAGCGDLNWISKLDLRDYDYLGVDVVRRESWAELDKMPGIRFQEADICSDSLRPADLTICRDVLIHLPNPLVIQAIDNFRVSSRYLLATSFEGSSNTSRDIASGEFAELDLNFSPFNLGPPALKLPERFCRKYLGLWKLSNDGEAL